VATKRRLRPTGLCHACRGARWSEAKLCRRRTCPGYGKIWAGDQRRKQFVNLGHYGDTQPYDVRAQVVLGAVTAPGAAQLPWDAKHCAALGAHECSGAIGCRVKADAAREWNESAPKRWRDLHRQASIRCSRAGLRPWLLARVWEKQRRGVLHVHPVLAFSTAAEKIAARAYMRHLAELAPQYGFGHLERKIRPMEAKAAAAYLSSYFVTGKKGKEALQTSVRSRSMPRSIVHISPRLTQATGCTMRELRFRRFVWRVAGGLVEAGFYEEARAIAVAKQVDPNAEPIEVLKALRGVP